MNHRADDALVDVRNERATSQIVLVCEHASAHIPDVFGDLGLSDAARQSHIAWDPGALEVAAQMALRLNAVLVASRTSRLVFDCNRPPDASDAMPEQSEVFEIPGNVDLTAGQKADRVAAYYQPFHATVAEVIAQKQRSILITVHSFTPVYNGKVRDVEIGVLHDSDARLADALLSRTGARMPHMVRRNDPYGPQDGVTHTLRKHAIPDGNLNVMLEVRNDLISSREAQIEMADLLSDWMSEALSELGAGLCKR